MTAYIYNKKVRRALVDQRVVVSYQCVIKFSHLSPKMINLERSCQLTFAVHVRCQLATSTDEDFFSGRLKTQEYCDTISCCP